MTYQPKFIPTLFWFPWRIHLPIHCQMIELHICSIYNIFDWILLYILTLFPRRKTSCISFIYNIAPSNTFSTAAALRITTTKQFKPLINMRKHHIPHLIYSSICNICMYKERSHLKISLSLCYIIKIMWHFHTHKKTIQYNQTEI